MAEADINKRIAEEQAKIEVPSYQDVAIDGAWKRRSSMMWGLSILGVGFGAVFGLAAAGLAAAGGIAVTTKLVLDSVAIFAATGMSTGLATGVVVGSSAGAAASSAKEIERRMLARDIEQKIRENPDANVEMHTTPAPEPKQPFRLSDYVNIKTALLFAAIGTVGGLIAASAFIAAGGLTGAGAAAAFAMPAMSTLLGTATPSATALTIYSTGLGTAFGAFFGVNVPKLARLAGNLAGDMLSGKAIDAPWPKEANLPEQKPILSPMVNSPEPETPSKTFSDKVERKPNYEALVSQAIKDAESYPSRA